MDESEQIMMRYLLGELSEQEQSALEEKYFTDPEVFDQVLKTESELVDAYARGRLSKETRERMEQFYMAHPVRAERVKFAAALTSRLDHFQESGKNQATSPVSWWQTLLVTVRGNRPTLRFAMALASLFIVFGTIWVWMERQKRERVQSQVAYEAQQQRERERTQAAEETRRAKELTDEQERIAKQTPAPAPTPQSDTALHSVSLALSVGGVRGGDNGQIPTLIIQPLTTQAQLLLNLKTNDFPSYRVTLQTVAGVEIFNQSNVKPRVAKSGASFAFIVPAKKLASGDYVLTLGGVSANGEVENLTKSLFRVEKK